MAIQALKETFTRMSENRKKKDVYESEDKKEDKKEKNNDLVELSPGCNIFISKQQEKEALASSLMNKQQALEKARLWEETQAKYLTMSKEEVRRQKKSQATPPIYADTGELYTGPYDPCKMLKYLLRTFFTNKELAAMSAEGRKFAAGGNAQVPPDTLDAILKFTIKHCAGALLTKRHINDVINGVCSYARKKENTVETILP